MLAISQTYENLHPLCDLGKKSAQESREVTAYDAYLLEAKVVLQIAKPDSIFGEPRLKLSHIPY